MKNLLDKTGYKVLVADDDKNVLSEVISFLSGAGYSVLAAPDGEKALEIAIQKQPDLILLDWVMPKRSGIKTLEKLKALTETYEIPVMMLTAQSEPEDLQFAFDLGVVDYIKKPFNEIELLSRIQSHLNVQKMIRETHRLKINKLKKENKNLSTELSQKNNQLKSMDVKHHQHTEALQKIEKLFENLLDTQLTFTQMVRDLKTEVGSLLNQESLSVSDSSFLHHEYFIEQLLERYPQLSESELRICSLITLNMSNKEIADALLLSVRTVENHRYHIGKKLDLSKETSLKEFLEA